MCSVGFPKPGAFLETLRMQRISQGMFVNSIRKEVLFEQFPCVGFDSLSLSLSKVLGWNMLRRLCPPLTINNTTPYSYSTVLRDIYDSGGVSLPQSRSPKQ